MSISVIGIAGGSRTGKDWIVSNVLEPVGFRGAGFADHFKIELVGKGVMTWEEAFVTKPKWVRDALQARGEAGRQEVGDSVWVDTLFADLRRLEMRFGLNRFVVTDCRHPNEVQSVQVNGGKVYKIHAPERWAANGMTDEQRAHISEQFAASSQFDHIFDGIIQNDPAHAESVPAQVRSMLTAHGMIAPIHPSIRTGTTALPCAAVYDKSWGEGPE